MEMYKSEVPSTSRTYDEAYKVRKIFERFKKKYCYDSDVIVYISQWVRGQFKLVVSNKDFDKKSKIDLHNLIMVDEHVENWTLTKIKSPKSSFYIKYKQTYDKTDTPLVLDFKYTDD